MIGIDSSGDTVYQEHPDFENILDNGRRRLITLDMLIAYGYGNVVQHKIPEHIVRLAQREDNKWGWLAKALAHAECVAMPWGDIPETEIDAFRKRIRARLGNDRKTFRRRWAVVYQDNILVVYCLGRFTPTCD